MGAGESWRWVGSFTSARSLQFLAQRHMGWMGVPILRRLPVLRLPLAEVVAIDESAGGTEKQRAERLDDLIVIGWTTPPPRPRTTGLDRVHGPTPNGQRLWYLLLGPRFV